MSSLNITTRMKATLLHVVAVARSQVLMLLDAPLLELWRSRPLAYREGKHRKLRMAHCYMSLLRGNSIMKGNTFLILWFLCHSFVWKTEHIWIMTSGKKKRRRSQSTSIQGCSAALTHLPIKRCSSRCASSHSPPSNKHSIICII